MFARFKLKKYGRFWRKISVGLHPTLSEILTPSGSGEHTCGCSKQCLFRPDSSPRVTWYSGWRYFGSVSWLPEGSFFLLEIELAWFMAVRGGLATLLAARWA